MLLKQYCFVIRRWLTPPDQAIGRALIRISCLYLLPTPILYQASGKEAVVDKQFWCHPELWSKCLWCAAIEEEVKRTAGFIQLRLKRLLMKSLNYSFIFKKCFVSSPTNGELSSILDYVKYNSLTFKKYVFKLLFFLCQICFLNFYTNSMLHWLSYHCLKGNKILYKVILTILITFIDNKKNLILQVNKPKTG